MIFCWTVVGIACFLFKGCWSIGCWSAEGYTQRDDGTGSTTSDGLHCHGVGHTEREQQEEEQEEGHWTPRHGRPLRGNRCWAILSLHWRGRTGPRKAEAADSQHRQLAFLALLSWGGRNERGEEGVTRSAE